MKCHTRAWMPLFVTAATLLIEVHGQFRQSCGLDDFVCNNGMCLEISKKCDRVSDCPGNEDELNCDCTSDEFRCKSDGSCIEKRRYCDGTPNCRDGSDEINCALGFFKCQTGKVIPESLRCNRRYDCSAGDYSDEQNCPCGDEDFRCDNGHCIQAYKRCDRTHDCQDSSDERHCKYGPCAPDAFTCPSGSRVACATRCDDLRECDNGEDEEQCDEDCDHECDGRCLDSHLICDGKPDCADESDEAQCDHCDRPDDFRCNDGECIHVSGRCNNATECSDGSDEQHCNETMPATRDGCNEGQFRCRDGTCLNNDFLCDGNRDCYDGSDEDNCPCQYYEFTCDNRQCIPESEKCNGRVDCEDGSDELPDICSPDNSYTESYPNNPSPDFTTTARETYISGSVGSNPSYSPYAPRTQSPQTNDIPSNGDRNDNTFTTQAPDGRYDPYVTDRPGSNNPYGANQHGSNDPYGANQPDSNDPYGSRQPGSSDPYGSRQPDSRNPNGSNQAGSNYPYGSNQPEPNDPYGSRQPATTNPNGSNQPGSNDPYGPNQPDSNDPYGSRQPGSSDPNGSRQPDSRNPNGSNQPGSNYPYGSNQPDSNNPYGSRQPGSNDPYGSRQPDSRNPNGPNQPDTNYPYGSNQPEPNDPYGSRQPGSSDSNGSNQPGSNDPYGSRQPGSNNPYGSGQQGSNNGYGANQPGSSDPYGSSQPGSNDIDSNRIDTYPNQYPDSDNQSGGGRYPSSPSSGQGGRPGYRGPSEGSSDVCKSFEWRCENGPCIAASRRCDGHIDCPYDFSDEFDCPPGSPITLNVKTHPDEQTVRFGGDVVFQCRDEGPIRAPVRWVREGGRSLKAGSTDKNGRLELYQVTLGDSGVYICQTPRYLGQPGSEVRVTLTVNRPQTNVDTRPPFTPCKPHQATCSNGECILKTFVCDGKLDCSDKSDEDMCNYNGICEPNQFQCDNRKCVLKSWMCDSDDDCGDGSDEKNCPDVDPNSPCLPMEFSCHSQSQCVPKSFHCDGRSDCLDGSDEIGCSAVYITKPPYPANVRLNPGDTLILSCQAVGIPEPIISWRLNWGHVPSKCTWTNRGGVGNLTCPNMMPDDSGAYSCEAINNKGTTFAVPDSIVFVSRTDPCPDGYFNDEARSQNDCIRCFCFGKATRCRSADLFTYNMPTPLGEGGTRLLGVALSGDGEVMTDPSIINHYYYQSMRNGAAVTKLESRDDNWLGNFHPYLTLPESYNGNQLTSYGGHIKYTVQAHAYALQPEDEIPAIIVKGKYATLFHVSQNDISSSESVIEARFVPEYWEKSGPNGNLIPTTREDIMMALDAVEIILLRADNNNAGVNITNFVMESAQHMNSGLGAASLVEECTCPEGYDGLSCQKCKPGYVRENSGPWLGQCVRKACPPGTYGDPSMGNACKPCPCPLTNKDNQFATTCSLGSDGSVTCDCFSGYEGKTCEKCSAGFEGNPLVVGDSCRVRVTSNCNPLGTRHEQLLGECICKDNVVGQFCNQCKNDSFYLSEDFRHGCASCFCSGESQQCMSSNLRRKTTSINFNIPSIVNEVKVYNTLPQGNGNFRYTAPVETNLRPTLTRGGLGLSGLDRSQPTVYYWSMPLSFAGDKVTAYGGFLRYTLDNVPSYVDQRLKNKAADVQLISENHMNFQYFGNFKPAYEGVLNVSVQLLEKGWQRSDGKDVPREHFLLALADVKTILIKATYSTDSIATPLFASIETADSDGDGPAALHVEQCVCPPGYIGTSCEDCAPGYTRGIGGLYLAHCEACQCNGHSNNCHPETGQCYECMDNTIGARCEICKDGYERDGYDNCIAYDTPTTLTPCRCDSRGVTEPCDTDGSCSCKRNVDGDYCDRCRAGTYGLDAANPDGCTPCFCSGATNECQEAKYYYRTAIPAPIFGDNYGGYTIMDINAETIINDQFMPQPDKSELLYIFTFPADRDLYWSLPVFPGNRVLSYGGSISLRQEFTSNSGYSVVSEQGNDVILIGDDVSVSWYNPNQLRSGESLSFQVPLREEGWTLLNSAEAADRSDFMHVLKSLRRVLVKATLAENILSTSIADVSMDTATDQIQVNAQIAKGVEICMCPPGHLGTSCETCAAGYYKNEQDFCVQCPCNDHDCQLDTNSQVVCNCRPPYTGRDCSTIGGGQPLVTTNRPPVPQSTVSVRITNNKDKQNIIIQEIGSSINLVCEADSEFTRRLLLSWSKVDGYLPQDRAFSDEYSGVLRITNLQITDSGQYLCQTSDGHSTGQASVTLKVPANQMVLPTVEIRPPVKEYYAGDRIQLECIASGSPQPTISWQRASRQPLPTNVEHYGNLLIIERAREEDSGEYSCIAENTVGSTDRVAVIRVRPRPAKPIRDRLIVQPKSATVNEGQSTTVVCTGSPNVPAGTIDWVRQDGDRFQANVRSDNGVLYIDVATLINAGVYVCQTHGADVAPEPVLLTVLTTALPSPDQAPDVTIPVQYLKVPSGESNKVDCFPRGQPLPIVRWTKYENEFGRGVSQRGDSLIINEAEESDAGYYVCQALDRRDNNVLTYKFVYVEIEKREKPLVEVWPTGEQPVALGNTQFEFTCRVNAGIPAPVITWSRAGGRELSSHVEIKPNNILRFEKIEVNDEGEYICTGDNSVGSYSASAVIKVRSPPEITITPRNYMEVTSGESVSMECRAEGYPEPWVTIKGPDQREISSSSRIASLRLTSVTERDDGTYACVATNLAGTIEDSFVIRVERGDGGYDYAGSGDIDIDPFQPEPNQPNQPYQPYQPSQDPDVFSIPGSRDMIVFEGKNVSMYCNVTNGYSPVWGRGDLQPLQRNAEQRGNYFYIYQVTKKDAGPYVCRAYNYDTREVQTAVYQNVRVLKKFAITLKPDRQVVQPGNSPTVECVVDAEDVIDITWQPITKPFSSRVKVLNATLIFQRIAIEDAGKYMCVVRTQYTTANSTAEVIVVGAPEQALVRIEQPNRAYREGENVEVSCNSMSRDIIVEWIKRDDQGNRQHVDSNTFGGGSMLMISGVAEEDAGVYQCIGRNRFGQNYTDNFDLEVLPGTAIDLPRYSDEPVKEYSAALRSAVDIPCIHELEDPTSIRWRREYTAVPVDARSNQPILHINSVKEGDAGTYVCRASNRRTSIETKSILRVVGVVPLFDGNSWVALPTLKDAYRQFDIEISFKPTDFNGLILYNSQNSGRITDYLALLLRQGVPWFIVETGNGPAFVRGNKPLTLNQWHTIRLNKIGTKVTMDVDTDGPFEVIMPDNYMLELRQPLYIGGVPDQNQLPAQVNSTNGFAGCVSMLVLGQAEKNIMIDQLDQYRVAACNSCAGNLCQNGGICQEARNERGYVCICNTEFAGINCDRRGEACRPGLCGTGKCTDTNDGYKCACPITHTGKNCETRQQIDYPAFTGSEFLAMKPPNTYRFLKMSMKVKASAPVTDGIIMYCAESARGHGGFTSLAVKNGRLEFRYDLGEGTPVVLVSNTTLPANDWTDVQVTRSGPTVSLNINLVHNYEQRLDSSKSLKLETPMFVGGVDENIVLNSNTGVSVGFMGCIKDLKSHGISVDFANDPTVESSNVRECSERGDIQETENSPCRCVNGGFCSSLNTCICPTGFTGTYCETRVASSLRYASRTPVDPCAAHPCRNGGTCRPDYSNMMNHTCDCPLDYAGASCQMQLMLYQSVGFNGNGYLELPANLVNYDNLETDPVVIALRVNTVQDGVLTYQREGQAPLDTGDYLMIRIEHGHVVVEWDMGDGVTKLAVSSDDGKAGFVTDGEMHRIVVRLLSDGRVELSVDGITEQGFTSGISNRINADSNIYIGGMPERLNVNGYPGLIGCIDQVEFMDTGRGVNLGETAVTGRNTQPCKKF